MSQCTWVMRDKSDLYSRICVLTSINKWQYEQHCMFPGHFKKIPKQKSQKRGQKKNFFFSNNFRTLHQPIVQWKLSSVIGGLFGREKLCKVRLLRICWDTQLSHYYVPCMINSTFSWRNYFNLCALLLVLLLSSLIPMPKTSF